MIEGLLYETWIMFLEMSPYLLFGATFVALLNLLITKDFVKSQIGKRNIWSIFKASLFGIPLPLCSCGVIPTTVYLSDSDASKGSVTSFLISTPQTGVDSIIATYGLMGPVFAIYRPIAAFFMGIFGGLFINSVEKAPEKPKKFNLNVMSQESVEQKSWSEKVKDTLRYSYVEFIDDIVVQFLVGVLIAGAISYFVPADFMEGTGLKSGIWGMLLMIAVGAPMYICATASIPIAVSLMLKGFSPGVAFVFLAVGPATNAASYAILSKSIGKKITILYIAAVAVLSIISGYILDFIFSYYSMDPLQFMSHHSAHEHSGLIPEDLQLFLTIIFSVLIMASLYRKFIKGKFSKDSHSQENKIDVDGMTCNHCVQTVEKAVNKVGGVQDLDVDLSSNAVYFNGSPNISQIKKAIEDAGYTVK